MDAQSEHSPYASLILISPFLNRLNIWELIRQQVHIPQKTVIHAPHDKLLDVWLAMMTGGQGVVEANTRLRPDRALQLAFGRQSCAEQSSLSRTLSACTAETVTQLRACVTQTLRAHSRACAHVATAGWQVLDVDLTGLPAGRQAEGSTKGYFSSKPGLRGRQLGRVLASRYDEILVEQLYPGRRQLEHGFQPLLQQAAEVLQLNETGRNRTIVRVDGGGGDDANLNWALGQGFQVLAKIHNWQRAHRLAASVTSWYPDPKRPQRQVGWVTTPTAYARPTRQLAVRYPNAKAGAARPWRECVLVTSLATADLCWLARQPEPTQPEPPLDLLATLYAYDLREGGIETQNRSDKQGLGLANRNKRPFAAQEMLVLLAQLAHNAIIWTRNQLAEPSPTYASFGIKRMVRDVFSITGTVQFLPTGQLAQIQLNPDHPHTQAVLRAFT